MPFINSKNSTSVVIVGCGGMALELYDYLRNDSGITIRGFLDDNANAQLPEYINLPLIGDTGSYVPEHDNEVAIVGIGNPNSRLAVLQRLWGLGVPTPAYAAHNAHISPHARLGAGSIVSPFSVINHGAYLASGVLVNIHCGVGHGAKVGSFSVLSPCCIVNGDATVGEKCFLGTRVTIFPRIQIGNGCVIDSHTAVRRCSNDKVFITDRGKYKQLPLAQ